MKYLYAYIKEVEQEFKGIFVYDNEAKNLIEEVNKALKRKMKRVWERK